MKIRKRVLLVFLAILLVWGGGGVWMGSLWGESNSTVQVSGFLVDSSGIACTGNKNITFNFYPSLTGGTSLWNETLSVSCEKGVYTAVLGSSSPFGTLFSSNNTLYLGVTVEGDTEMTPRSNIGSCAYAQRATVADSVGTTTVSTSSIANSAVTAEKIATGAVTTTGILDGTIAAADLADSAITSAKISDGTIATADLASSAVTAAKIDQSSNFTWTGTHTFGVGTSTATGKPVLTANVNTTSVGNTDTAEDDLMTYTLPANALSANGKGLRIRAWGTAKSNSSLAIKMYFGGTAIISTVRNNPGGAGGTSGFPFGGMNSAWRVEAIVIRTGASTQISNAWIFGDCVSPNSCSPQSRMESTSPTETLSSAVTIKCTGVAATGASPVANDVQQSGLVIEALN